MIETWEERFEEKFAEKPETDSEGNPWWILAHKKRLMDFIRAEKSKSYQEGLEKAKEVLEGMRFQRTDNLEVLEYRRNGLTVGQVAGENYNSALSEAQEKIQELIDQK